MNADADGMRRQVEALKAARQYLATRERELIRFYQAGAASWGEVEAIQPLRAQIDAALASEAER